MAFNVGLSFVAAGVTLAVLAIGIYRGPRSVVQGIFAFGMLLLSLEAALTGFVYQSSTLSEFLFRQRLLFIICLSCAGCLAALQHQLCPRKLCRANIQMEVGFAAGSCRTAFPDYFF